MPSFLQKAVNQKLAHPPDWLTSNLSYECTMGSRAYAVNNQDADYDQYGFCIPPKDVIFPHLAGVIVGFGNQGQKFEQYEQQKILIDGKKDKEVSFSIYSIVKYFQLCMENNPNMIDSLFVPENCVTYSNSIGQLVREKRKLFLSKQCWPKFKGYAFSQLHKLDNKTPTGKRLDIVQKHGYDTKFAYNILRLLDECEQILTLGDLDLQRSREQMKSIRRGEWSEAQLREYFAAKLPVLEKAYSESRLPQKPNEETLKELLFNCLEMHYGNLSAVVIRQDQLLLSLRQIEKLAREGLCYQ